jgi:hypothetical protein
MEQFLGLSRDASREKSEAGTSPYARNVVFDKQVGSITQENGFVSQDSIRGLIIGIHATNAHIIYITYQVETKKTLIVYVDTNTKQVTEVLETNYFNYSVERPIEIIAWYNYNQDLIIMFSDGVFEKSTAPRLINLMDIGVKLNNNKEFLNEEEANSTLLFSNIAVPRYSIKYGNKTTNDVDLLFFTIAYVLPDGVTTTRFLPILAEAYPLFGFKSEYKKSVTFKIEDLDPFFSQFVIGIIAFRDNAIFAYNTDFISYTDSTYEYTFNSITGLNVVTPDSIIVEKATFEKVKSLTIGNDVAILGGIVTKKVTSYQKYANNLKLNLYFDYRLDNRHQAPLLCPDEVYYFTIAAIFNNGTYSEEFHIPNRDAVNTDLDFINKTELGLTDLPDIDISKFKVINTGGWVNPSVGLPNFNNLSETKLNWGYWQNKETYPNTEDYNGSVDYDNNTAIVNGRDLRNTNVKLHRVPGLDNLSKKFPIRVGVDIQNEILSTAPDYHTRMPAFSINVENFLEAFSSVIDSDGIKGYRLSFVKKDDTSKIVEDINFVKPMFTGTELDVLDEDNVIVDGMITGATGPPLSSNVYKYHQFGFSRVKSINLSVYKGNRSPTIIKANYGLFDYSNNTLTIPSNVENAIDKAYRKIEADKNTNGTVGQYSYPSTFVSPVGTIATAFLNVKIVNPNTQYAVVKSIEQTPGNTKSFSNLFTHENIKLKAKNSNTVYPVAVTAPPAYGWNPLNYAPTSLTDTESLITVNVYDPLVNAYVNRSIYLEDLRRINISSTLLNLKNNVHEGLQPKSFVTVGQTNIENSALLFKDFGDTFSNNVYSEISEEFFYYKINGANANIWGVAYFQNIFSGLLAIDNNTLVEFVKDKILGYIYITDNSKNDYPNEVDKLLAFDYTKQLVNKESTRQLNSLIANIAFYYNKKYINKFPYRIVKSLTMQSENLSTSNIRTFLANAYYDMPSLRGELTSVTGTDKGVYCQQRYSLSIFQLKERLTNNDENSAYLAEADLFAYKPKTIIDEDNKGYIGSVHQFGRKLTKEGLLVVDAERGKIYIIGGDAPTELSKIKMSNFFREVLNLSVENKVPTLFSSSAVQDNPYNGNGILFGVDDRTNRILITINNYTPLDVLPEDVNFINGVPYKEERVLDIKNNLYTKNNSNTLSFNLDWKRWVAEHDYLPQFYINTNKRNYAGINNTLVTPTGFVEEVFTYITNENKAKAGKYFHDANNVIYESYIDLLFNSRYDLSKWYKSVLWRTTVKDSNNKNIEQATIDAIMLYTDYQCSGRTELNVKDFSLIRNSEGLWNFNDFRDLAKSINDLPVTNDGSYDVQKVYLNRNWFDKSDFISNFILVRLIMNNVEDTQTHIHNVNVEARISDRI